MIIKIGKYSLNEWQKYNELHYRTYNISLCVTLFNSDRGYHPRFINQLSFLQNIYNQTKHKEFLEIELSKEYIDNFLIKMSKLVVFL